MSFRSDDPVLLRRLSAVEKARLGVSSSVGPSGAAGPAGPAFQFPVGSIFMATVATNPATLLGYGTWTALAAGKVLVGNDGGAFPAGATGGATTHTHSVTSNVAVASHGTFSTGTGDVNTLRGDAGATVSTSDATAVHTVTPPAHAVTNNAVTSGAGSSLPPYLVVYIWSRAS